MADWTKLPGRGTVEDRRGMMPAMGGGLGLLGIVVVVAINLLGGGSLDTSTLNQALDQLNNLQTPTSNLSSTDFEGADDYEVFTSTVLGSANDVWRDIFSKSNQTYLEPKVVLFRTATSSACGGASSQAGPHYCSRDQTIYIDETFYAQLQQQFGAAGGDVAEAYVLAHEVGHHVQEQLGILDQLQSSPNTSEANMLSIQIELQADCLAGIWANSLKDKGVFAAGEINEAIDAAAAVGDDRIQQTVEGRITPENWTHGSSQQRVAAFNVGYNSGDPGQCKL